MKQKPTMTPREQLQEKLADRGGWSMLAHARAAKKLGMAPLPPADHDELDLGNGGRAKVPVRYE